VAAAPQQLGRSKEIVTREGGARSGDGRIYGYTRRPHGRMKTCALCLHGCARESTKTSLLPSLGYDHPSAARLARQDPLTPTDTVHMLTSKYTRYSN
jgi:hypothetical protein